MGAPARSTHKRGLGGGLANVGGDEPRLQPLIRMEVACQLALESLPELPRETENRLREPIQILCDVTRSELDRLRPSAKLS